MGESEWGREWGRLRGGESESVGGRVGVGESGRVNGGEGEREGGGSEE